MKKRHRERGVLGLALAALVPCAAALQAQGPPAETRTETIARQKADKAQRLHPYVPSRVESLVRTAQEQFMGGEIAWHPFFESAYAGGGFAFGVGYLKHVSAYNTIDVRGSYTIAGYKRVEAEFLAPRVLKRHGRLSVLGGWREATAVGFFGLGTANTSKDDRTSYAFRQPYASATLETRPARGMFVLNGGAEYSTWDQRSGSGSFPSVEEVYSPDTLPGLGERVTYLHTNGTLGIDWRSAAGYARRGGYYGVTVHDFIDTDDRFGFRQVDYDVVQHLPILRDVWVLSLRGRAQTTAVGNGQQVPFFMLPSLGGGSTLRGFPSWRFRDRHSLLLSAEWRVLINDFLDTVVFADAGKVTSRAADLDLTGLKSSVGFGVRLHGPAATPLRIDIARSREGLAIVFAAQAVF